MGQEFQLIYRNQIRTLQSIEIDAQNYIPIDQIAVILDISIESVGNKLLVHGPQSTLELTDGNRLIGLNNQYHLLSNPVLKRENRWLVPTEFIEESVPRALNFPVTLKLVRDPKNPDQISVQVLNSPNRVTLIFLPSAKEVTLRVEESDETLHIKSDQNSEFLEPLVKPESSLIASLNCVALKGQSGWEIVKGIDFRSHWSRKLGDPERLIVDVFSTAVGEFNLSGSNEHDTESLAGNVITIDPGHGGENQGVMSQGIVEKNITAEICRFLRAELEGLKLVTDSTHSSDFNPSLRNRSSVANGNQSKVFISIHLGGSFSKDIHGPVVFTHQTDTPTNKSIKSQLKEWNQGQSSFAPESRKLATLIQEKLNTLFKTENQSATAPLKLLAPVEAPAVLIEAGYLTSARDLKLLLKPNFQKEIATSIADAIVAFLR